MHDDEGLAAPAPDPAVLAAYGLSDAAAEPLGRGLINRTWRLRDTHGTFSVLQAVNPIFPGAMQADIDVVTRHLAACGLVTPRLLATPGGRLWVDHAGVTWRLLSYVEGVTHDFVTDPEQAREAGRLLARFHRALADLQHTFAHQRPGVHDTVKHLAALSDALAAHTQHPAFNEIEPLARRVLALGARLPPLATAPERLVHGDPKISNIVFDADGKRALCMIDLDTLARMPLALELGDACRSWCNPVPEDAAEASFSLAIFTSAMQGYASAAKGWIQATEWPGIVDATLVITVELAARFCADALRENYFGWDRERYPSASAHNRARTRGQLALAEALGAERSTAERVLQATF
jgi:Ser/Thr protein kinase RdoA (MazF antagonist)